MKIYNLLIIMSLIITVVSCKKDDDKAQTSAISTSNASDIDVFKVTCGGNITSDGGSAVTERGVCWSMDQNPTISDNKTSDGEGIGSFTSALTGLQPKTKYYAKAYAINKEGTAYGDSVSFTTLDGVMDADSNVYHAVIIGSQTWLKENLKTTKYKNGTSIPLVTDNTAWGNLTTPGYCWFQNNKAFKSYGALYNWYTVNTGSLCPSGWHVPTNAEWTTLIDHLGGESIAGGKLKEDGTTHWFTPNTGATNTSGFTALPSGCRTYNALFQGRTTIGKFWSATVYNASDAWYQVLYFDVITVTGSNYNKKSGCSVRCVRD